MQISILATATVSGVLDALLPEFERATGHTVVRWDATAGKVRDRILEGAPGNPGADVGFITGSVIADVEKAGRIVPASKVVLARSPLGVAIRKGAPRPDLSSEDAIKALIGTARTIALTDPAGGGNTGRYFMGVADRLGVGEALRAKTRLYRHGGHVSEGVAAGEADFGITVISEIVPIAGAEVAGPLPDSLQNVSITYAALLAGAPHPDAGQALIAFLTSPAAEDAIRAHGMQPG
jgi:molybdate transport system substrate-binding protein